MQIGTKAVVLSARNMEEHDRLVTLLTQDHGLVTAYAKGARRQKGTMASATEQLSYSAFQLFRSREKTYVDKAEAATIFFRLMTDEYRAANWSTVNDFTDVSAGGWYNNAISTCASAGALKGRGDGTKFDPNAPITRGEFAVIAARFLDESHVDDGKGDFADTADHWAAREIRLAAKAGWITGSGSKFRPDEPITRAEVMTIVNRMLDRTPDRDHMLSEMKRWTDNPEDAWYYEAVQEATNEHAYERVIARKTR